MLDTALRPLKDQALSRPAGALPKALTANLITAGSLAITLGAALVIWNGDYALGLTLWFAGRLLDGLDGVVARLRGTANDFGGYVDMVADTIGYAAIPLAVALQIDTRAGWISVAFLLAAFYVNTISWTFLAAILERRGRGAAATGEPTTLTMPTVLVEGAETIAFFVAFLLLPASAPVIFGVMALAVSINVVQRIIVARSLA